LFLDFYRDQWGKLDHPAVQRRFVKLNTTFHQFLFQITVQNRISNTEKNA
jgi:hypothetical protein